MTLKDILQKDTELTFKELCIAIADRQVWRRNYVMSPNCTFFYLSFKSFSVFTIARLFIFWRQRKIEVLVCEDHNIDIILLSFVSKVENIVRITMIK